VTDNVVALPSTSGLRAIHLAPFGQYTRYVLAAYARHVFVVVAVIIAVALTIDVWPQLELIIRPDDSALLAIWHVARFAALRTPDLLCPLLPLATFLGVVWTEIVLTQSHERTLIWNSGRSPIKCLMPAILLGLALNGVEFGMDVYLRPAAMAVQMSERLGKHGVLFDRTIIARSHWIVSPEGLLRTEISYGPPVVLRNLTLYSLDPRGHLREVDTAATARPLSGGKLWILRDGRYWTARAKQADNGPDRITSSIGDPGGEVQVPFSERVVPMSLNLLWLSHVGIYPEYLPIGVLRALAADRSGPLVRNPYRSYLQLKYGGALLPGAMALLAAAMSLLSFAYRVTAVAVVGTLFGGYVAHFANKVFLLLGRNDYLAPVTAGWTTPILITVLAIMILRTIENRRKPNAGRVGPIAERLRTA
jgi:lipopolysaccharide export system permease protein